MSDTNFDDLPWDEIQYISKEGIFEEVFKKIPKARFRFAAKEENRDLLVSSALRNLRRTDPNASRNQALLLADIMQEFAKRVLEEKA